MLGTDVWPLISFNAAWIAAPSSGEIRQFTYSLLIVRYRGLHTNLIKLNSIVLGAEVVQEGFAGLAVRAVRFAEYRYALLEAIPG